MGTYGYEGGAQPLLLLAYKLYLLSSSQERVLSPVKSFQCLGSCCRKQFIGSAILMLQINIKGSTERISMRLNASHLPPSLFEECE